VSEQRDVAPARGVACLMRNAKHSRPDAHDKKSGERESREEARHIAEKQRGPNEHSETAENHHHR
jgi:hypothetical protein